MKRCLIIYLFTFLLFSCNNWNKKSLPEAEIPTENEVTDIKTISDSQEKGINSNVDKKEELALVNTESGSSPIVASNDTTSYGWNELKQIKNTPYMDNYKKYLRTNNKYKDWDSKNPKEVIVECIVEKDGTTSNLSVKKSSGDESLDKEAIRLIKEAKMKPGIDLERRPIRCRDIFYPVWFPPK